MWTPVHSILHIGQLIPEPPWEAERYQRPAYFAGSSGLGVVPQSVRGNLSGQGAGRGRGRPPYNGAP